MYQIDILLGTNYFVRSLEIDQNRLRYVKIIFEFQILLFHYKHKLDVQTNFSLLTKKTLRKQKLTKILTVVTQHYLNCLFSSSSLLNCEYVNKKSFFDTFDTFSDFQKEGW